MADTTDRARLSKVEALFAAARELPPARRAAFLAEQSAGDPKLRDEVAGLLELDERAGEFLEQPADPWVGRSIDRWRLVRRLGAGGMGVVYLAERDDGVVRQKAALKLLKQGIEHAEMLERFRRERQVLAALSHPNIARLIDGGATPDGIPWLVMELVEGTRLDRYCDERRLPLERRLALFRDVCAAVHYAHQNLVVHRDLKPSNVLVTDDGVAKLVDFGVSKVLEASSGADATRTIERRLTPEYASPEVVRGAAVTTASDLFSLGVVLYELLTGARPWQVAESSPTALERAITESAPPRPSAAAIDAEAASARSTDERSLRRALRGDLDAIVMTALAPEPDRRYASAQALAADLERHLKHEPIVARPPGAAYVLSKFVRRRRALVVAAIVALLAIGGGIGVALAGFARGEAQAKREAASRERVIKLMREMLVQLDPSTARGFSDSMLKQLHFAANELDSGLLADDPGIESDLRLTLGRVYGSFGYAGWARTQLEKSLVLAEKIHAPGDPRRIAPLHWLGWSERSCAAYADAERHLRAAVELARASGRDEERANALRELGLVLTDLRRFDESEAALREAIATRETLPGDSRAPVASMRIALALNLLERGDAAGAEPMARAALAASEALFRDTDPRFAFALDTHGRVLLALRRPDEAEPLLERSLELRRGLYDPTSPFIAWSLVLLAEAQRAQQRSSEAVPLLEEAVEIRRKHYDKDAPLLMRTLLEYGLALHESDEPAEAVKPLGEGLAIALKRGLERDPLAVRAGEAIAECRQAIAE